MSLSSQLRRCWVWGHPKLHSKFQTSMIYFERSWKWREYEGAWDMAQWSQHLPSIHKAPVPQNEVLPGHCFCYFPRLSMSDLPRPTQSSEVGHSRERMKHPQNLELSCYDLLILSPSIYQKTWNSYTEVSSTAMWTVANDSQSTKCPSIYDR